MPPDAAIVSKGGSADAEAYSAFAGTPLAGALRAQGVRRLFVGGLATEYCVGATVRDALREGFAAVVLADAVRAVDVRPGDGAACLASLRDAGATLLAGSPAD